MSAKSFFIAHGEKLLVVAIAGGCAYIVTSHLGDASFRPREDSSKIDAMNVEIDKVFQNQEPPVIKEPRPYLDQLLARLGEKPPIAPKMAWTTVPPDLSPGGPKEGPYLYVYELPSPNVILKDVVGQLEITVQIETDATAPSGSGRRVSAEPDRQWPRTTAAGMVVNTGHHLGICLEIRIGETGEFKPLVLPGATKDGILPLSILGTPLVFSGAEPWQKHYVRARLVAAATSYDPKNTDPRPKATVLVMPGILSKSLSEDQKLIERLEPQVKKGAGADFDKILAPEGGLALPVGTQVAANEHVFRGPPAIEKQVVTGTVRFALVGITSELQQDGTSRDVAKFKFLKRFTQGAEAKWVEKPIDLKYAQGEKLGQVVKGPNPFLAGKLVEIDLQTPFMVEKLLKAQPRVLYWLIKPKARPGGGKDRDLELDKREQPTDIVVLKNPASGNEMTLTKLGKVNPPPQAKVVVFPFRAGPVDELEEFTKAPSDFQQYDLIPAEPKSHEPGHGPLAELQAKKKLEGAADASTFQTDTTYYEMADGRLAWWDTVNHEMATYDPNSIEKPSTSTGAAPVPVQAPVPVPVKPPVGNLPKPPAMPPGMVPPGMPPGMQPGVIPPGPPKR